MAFRTLKTRLKDRKGQQMVEMVLVMPVLLILLGVIITSGQLVYAKILVQTAAFQGARQAVVRQTAMDGRTAADERAEEVVLTNGLGAQDFASEFNYSGNWSKASHSYLTYTVRANVRTLFPVIGTDWRVHSLTPVSGTIVMLVERG